MLDRYVQALTQLSNFPVPAHWTERRANAQFKALMLLAVLDAIGSSAVTENMIVPDYVLVGMFDAYWTRVTRLSPHQINAALAFYELRTEGFWHLIARPGMAAAVEAWGQPHSLGDLRQRVAGALLDDDLYELLLDEARWTTLRRAVMWTYFSMNDWDEIESISAENQSHARWQSQAAPTLQTRSAPLPRTYEPVLGVEAEPQIADAASTPESPDGSGAPIKSMAAIAIGDNAASSVSQFSLLSESAVRLLDGIAPEWRSAPLSVAGDHSSTSSDLTTCGITTLGDLEHVSPVVLLALATPREGDGERFWPSAVTAFQREYATTVAAAVAAALSNALAARLAGVSGAVRRTVATPAAGHEPQKPLAQPTASSLLVSIEEVLQDPDSHQTPLIGPATVQALMEAGCPLHMSFVAEQWWDEDDVGWRLGTRISNALARAGIYSLDHLVSLSPRELFEVRNFGITSYREVVDHMRAYVQPWIAQLPEDLRPAAPAVDNSELDNAVGITPQARIEETEVYPATTSLDKDVVAGLKAGHVANERSMLLLPIEAVLSSLNWVHLPNSPSQANEIHLTYEDVCGYPLLSARDRAALAALGCNVLRQPLLSLFADQDLLPLAVRTRNLLLQNGIENIAQLSTISPGDLLGLRNFGAGCYREIVQRLQAALDPWLGRLNEAVALVPDQAPEERTATQGDVADERQVPSMTPVWRGVFQTLAELPCHVLDATVPDWRSLTCHQLVDASGIATEAPPEGYTIADYIQTVAAAEVPSPAQLAPSEHAAAAALFKAFANLLTAQLGALRDDAPKALGNVTVEDLLRLLAEGAGLEVRKHASSRKAFSREMEVLLARHGARDGQAPTLQELGERFDVTRERVRQMAQRAQDRLLGEGVKRYALGLAALVLWAVRSVGGVASVEQAAQRIAVEVSFDALDPVGTTRLLADWAPEISLDDGLLIRTPATVGQVRAVTHLLRTELTSREQSLGSEQIAGFIRKLAADSALSERTIQAIVLARGPRPPTDSMVAVTGVAGHSIKAQLIQLLTELGRPAHLDEIARHYSARFSRRKRQSRERLRACLIQHDDTFEQLSEDEFRLSEGRPARHTLTTLIEQVLAESARPLHLTEIVARVAELGAGTKGSIAVRLATSEQFRAFGGRFYGLRDRAYPSFDVKRAYADLFGDDSGVREAIVEASYVTPSGRLVVQMKLRPGMLRGTLPLTNSALYDCFPDTGIFCALAIAPSGAVSACELRRSKSAVTLPRVWLEQIGAVEGDYLLIERRRAAEANAVQYRIVCASPDRLAWAARAVGLTVTSDGGKVDGLILRQVTEPERFLGCIEQLLAHPWSSPEQACAALGFAPGMPHGAEYLALGAASGVLARGVVAGAPGTGEVVRPTARGVAWLARRQEPLEAAQALVLGLPAYRAHLRAKRGRQGADGTGSGEDGRRDAQLLAPKLSKVWDEQIALATGLSPAELDAAPAIVSTASLPGDALALLLLLLCAQSRGAGLALEALPDYGLTDVETALRRLRLLGLYLVRDEHAQSVGLAERVLLAVDVPNEIARRLRQVGSDMGEILAAVVGTALGGANAGISASDLAVELQAQAESLFNTVLAPAPTGVPEGARFADGEIVPCGFVPLAADWGLCPDVGAEPPFAFLSDALTSRAEREVKVTVCLSQELIAQEWTAARHLAANAHLALLVLAAGDMGGLAERIARGEGGWRLDGMPLVMALDVMLRGLGYDVWDAAYRDDPALVKILGDELIGLGERLGLLTTDGTALEAEDALASAVYYRAYALVGRMVEALSHPRVVG